LQSITARLRQHEDKVFLSLTLAIGLAVGLAVVAFIVLTENLGARMYPPGGSPWLRLLVPCAGSLIAGVLLVRFFPDARGSGIPQTRAAIFAREGRISLRTVVGKFICCSATLASGVALGREGPSVQIGAGIASVIGRKLGLGPEKVKALIPVGAAAALAAAFNTPIAAVLFTLEEVVGDMNTPVLGSVVVSSATAWLVLHLFLGDQPLFQVPAYQLAHPSEFALYAVLGVAGGFISVLFTKSLLWLRGVFLAFPVRTRWMQPFAGGLVTGLLALAAPAVMGVGYSYVSIALHGQMALGIMLLLLLLKMMATTVCYSSGNAGGIFGPSLFMGAMLGGSLGSVAHQLFPNTVASPGAYALVGMGAAFAGIIRTPMTSVIMIFELTRDYNIIVPLMIANLVSFLISHQFQRESIYEALAKQDGIHLPSGARTARPRERVSHLMNRSAEPLTPSATSADALLLLELNNAQSWPVALDGQVWSMIRRDDLTKVDIAVSLRDMSPDPTGDRERLDADSFPHLHPDQTLDLALARFGSSGLDHLPVVDRADVRRYVALLSLSSVLAKYGITPAYGSDARTI